MDSRKPEPEPERSLARELRLVRRRSRLPWVYSVYHRPLSAPADASNPVAPEPTHMSPFYRPARGLARTECGP
jgi:hypothetical protein